MAEAAFSEDGKYFAAISSDGRLKIWDTETNVLKQEYTPDLHLTSPPSCLQWITVSTSSSPQKGQKRKSISENETQCIALGTSTGKLLLYSVSQAKVESVIQDNKNNEAISKKVVSLDWHRKYGLYSCNKANYIYEWDIQSCSVRNKYNVNLESKKSQVSAIKIVPHAQKTPSTFLVTATHIISIWRLHNSDATIIKCLGHHSSSKALLSIAGKDNTYWLIEGSQTERLLSFWDITISEEHLPQVNGDAPTPKRQRKKSISNIQTVTVPTYNFVLEDAPKLIDVSLQADDGHTRLNLAAVTRSGVVHYYGHTLNGSSTKPIKPSVTVQVTTPDAEPLPLQCCQLRNSEDILLGYMNGPALIFDRVTPDTKSKTQVLIRGDPKAKTKRNKQKSGDATKVREGKGNDVTYVEPLGGVSRKRVTPGGTVEVPMEARLENLALDVKSRGKNAVEHNLTKLLMQGLHSKDQDIILTVLQKNNPNVAFSTVSKLPADHVPQLLEQLALMATRKTSQCSSVCTWLHAVLRCHSALLLANVNTATSDHLARLLAIFTHRRSQLCQLLNLRGRLELTMSLRSARDSVPEQDPVLEYNDTSSDDEMEVDKYESDASEQSFEERSADAESDLDADTDTDGD